MTHFDLLLLGRKSRDKQLGREAQVIVRGGGSMPAPHCFPTDASPSSKVQLPAPLWLCHSLITPAPLGSERLSTRPPSVS